MGGFCVSRSYKTEVPKPTSDQQPKKFKKHFNKKIRQNVKKQLDDYIITGTLVEESLLMDKDI